MAHYNDWLPPAASAAANDTYVGDGTAFAAAVNHSGAGFACAYPYLGNFASVYFAAINKPQYAGGAQCGHCAVVRCIDLRCSVRNKDILVQILDLCPECK